MSSLPATNIEQQRNGCSFANVMLTLLMTMTCQPPPKPIQELPRFIIRQCQLTAEQEHNFTTAADPTSLQGKQLSTYNLVKQHVYSNDATPLRVIVSGTAGTGKSYLIHCLRLLLKDKVCVVARACHIYIPSKENLIGLITS